MKVVNLTTEYKTNPLGIDVMVPRLSWVIASKERDVKQIAYRITASSSLKHLKQGTGLLWDSGIQNSEQSIHVEYKGTKLESRQCIYWQVEAWDNHGNTSISSEPAWWEMGLLDPADWKAGWITQPWENDSEKSAHCPHFRTSFNIAKPVSRGRIYVTCLGLYELELNGKKVGNQVFTPGWTNYRKRLQYQVYDVTDQLREGENSIGSILGDGWYRGHLGWWDNNRNTYGKALGLLLRFEIRCEDGTERTIMTDKSWKAAPGPILKSDIYNGETYDARLEMPWWSSPGFDDSGWKEVKSLKHSKTILIASAGENVKKIKEIRPVGYFVTPKGEKVFDLGQNMVGWVRLKVKGNSGDRVVLKFAEVLDQKGNFYTENLRKIECTDTYILKGTVEEIYEPRFTFHGFRYVKVEGYPGELTKDSITGIVIHSDMKPIGTFECSEPLVNRLQQNIQWSQRGNFLDVPTDCPQRDERLGWTGDAQVFAPTASFNFNTAAFFTKWMKDLSAEQRGDGSVPWVVPNVVVDGGGTGWSDGFGATGWADAAVIIPWTVYLFYGDKRILEDQFDSMKAWVNYMKSHAGKSRIFDDGFHFGDWLSFSDDMSYHYNAPDYGFAGAHTDKSLIATAYFYHSTQILQKIAEIIGRLKDAEELSKLAANIKNAWRREFMTESGRLVSGTQTAYAIGLTFDLFPNDQKEIIAKRLAENVRHFGHLTTGFLGTPVLNHALSTFGYPDLAYQLLLNKRYPSWLYPVTRGATTIWERWDGIRPDGSFQTEGMNSFNHYAYGAIGEWLYSFVAGIKIDDHEAGYKHILFQPHPGGGLSHARASFYSMYGNVVCSWKIFQDHFFLELNVPSNTYATVTLPHAIIEEISESGQTLKNAAGIRNLNQEEFAAIVELGSGNYHFVYKWRE
ncbi:family 78 glycoside hydrolase catalytic domain [candidate division KSB1 bacterium]|nr:family 78 glycoside hydrolase catalytic domain [candidate division KSB1 bacterium]